MELLRLAFRQLGRRPAASRAVLAVALVGMLTGVAVLVAASVYSARLAEAGLRHTLATSYQSALDLMIAVDQRPLGPADYHRMDSVIQAAESDRTGWLTRDARRYGRTQTLPGAQSATSSLSGAQMVSLFFMSGFEDKARLVEGRWPEAGGAGPGFDVAIGARTIKGTSWHVGDTLFLVPYQDDPASRLPLRIVGIVDPVDTGDPYWVSGLPAFDMFTDADGVPVAPLYVPEDTFFGTFGASYASLVGNYWWLWSTDRSAVTLARVGEARVAVDKLEADINKQFPRSLVLSGVGQTVEQYERGLALARAPLYLFSGLLALFTLYFLATVAGLLLRTREREALLARSRGATATRTVALTALGEAMAAAALALAGGLALGLLIGRMMVNNLQPAGIEQGALSTSIAPSSIGLAAGLAVAGLVALIVMAYLQARREVAEMERLRTRPPRAGVFQRYYLDVLTALVAAWLWWQLNLRGGFLKLGEGRDTSVDLVVVLGPPLVLFAGALAVVRLYPWLLRLLAWALAPVAWASFALRRAARDPVSGGATVGLMMLAASLAVYGGVLATSLARGYLDRTRYETGGAITVRGSRDMDLSAGDLQALEDTGAVQAVSLLYRNTLPVQIGGQREDVQFLGVDPDSLASTAWFRGDFAAEPLPALLEPLKSTAPPGEGVLLPEGSTKVGLWVKQTDYKTIFAWTISLWARVRDSKGNYENVPLGDVLPTPDWSYLEGTLPNQATSYYVPPFHLTALFISSADSPTTASGTVQMDDLTVKDASGAATVVETFDGRNRWEPLSMSAEGVSTVDQVAEAARGAGSGLSFHWERRPQGGIGGVFLPVGPAVLPAVGGQGFVEGQTLLTVGGQTVVPIRVVKTARLFPTVQQDKPFLLVDRHDYQAYVRQMPVAGYAPTNELWLSPLPGVDRGQLTGWLWKEFAGFTVSDQEASVAVARRNPFTGEAWLGFIAIGAAALAGLAFIGMLLQGVQAVERGRVDFAVAQALGLSQRAVAAGVLVERLLIAAVGVAAGAALGLWLAGRTLRFMDISVSGVSGYPPAVVSGQWPVLLYTCAGLMAAGVIVGLISAGLARRMRPTEVLREEA